MAKPQMENGFATVASELLAALCIADFKKYQKAILAEMILAMYGPAKQGSYHIDHVRLAATIGVDPRIVRRNVGELEGDLVIVRQPDGSHVLAKDWESWLRDGSPRVGAGEARFVASCASRFGVRNPSTPRSKTGTNRSPKTLVKGTNRSPETEVKGTNRSPKTLVKGTGWSPEDADGEQPNAGANGDEQTELAGPLAGAGAHASEEFRLEKGEGGESPPPPLPGDRGGITPARPGLAPLSERLDAATTAAVKPAPLDAPGYDRSTPADRAVLDEAARLAAEVWPDKFQIHRAIRDRDGRFPHGWYLAAVRTLRVRPKDVHKLNYFMGMLRQFAKEGGPPEEDTLPAAAPKAIEYFRADPDTLYEPRGTRR